ncbi:prephenate dehydrogenase/arogenate dehydrogenase family protein [Roseobacter sp.]|uniref:prephenate dehydrogenase/arogenate dehydrogenase family protein n=1 Tax=Roseobacter sp. TaxID=1907202 RepID=UPI0038595CF6
MSFERQFSKRNTLGIIGFGAFGRLIAEHLFAHFDLYAYDATAGLERKAADRGITLTSLQEVAQCDVVVLATPVSCCVEVAKSIAPICRPGALVLDVGSVKVQPSEVMREFLPHYVHIVAMHPLFGPESGRDGIAGLKIAICPLRGCRRRLVARFLRVQLGLQVIETTPEAHDREAATVQGLTHLIGKVLLEMGPLPTRMTTRSFDLLVEAISMVQNDAPEVFDAIENANPYARDVRRRFFRLASDLNWELERPDLQECGVSKT